MISAVSLFLLAATLASLGQSRESGNVYTVSRLDGKLVHVHAVPVKHGNPHEVDYQIKAIGGAPVKLYRRVAGQVCCDGIVPIQMRRSGHWGDFKFKNLPAGSYWLSANVEGRDYVMPIEYQMAKEENSESSSHFKYEIDDSGRFEFSHEEVVTLD